MRVLMLASMACLTLVGCGEKSSGQKSSTRPQAASPAKEPPPRVPEIAFDLERATVGAGFTGNSCLEISAALKKIKVEKDEYETTKEYKDRLKKYEKEPIVDDIKINDLLSFYDSGTGYSTYDADKGTLNYESSYISSYIRIGTSHPMLIASSVESGARSYSAENAFGVKIKVDYKEKSVCNVIFSNLGFNGLEKPRKFQLKIKPEAAKKLDRNIRTIYIGTLTSPYNEKYSEHVQPSINIPNEVNISGVSLYLKLQQIWLVDKISGEVISKRKI